MANKLTFSERYILIECNREDAETIGILTSLPYYHSNRIKSKFYVSLRYIDVVLKVFRNIDETNINKAPALIRKLYHKEMQRRIDTDYLLTYGPEGDGSTDSKVLTLKRHQQLGVELARVNDSYGFFYDTRTGKTPMSLQIIVEDIKKHPDHKWLVLCPLILIENAWIEDIDKFYPDLNYVNLHATTKAKRLIKFATPANLYLQNIESFAGYYDNVKALGIHGCIVDESSAMKSNSSVFSKKAVEFSNEVKRWYLLSGTPAPNGEYEYYRQMQSVDYYGIQQSYAQFKEHFFLNTSYNPQYEKLSVRPDRQEKLNKLLRQNSIYIDKEDVLQTAGRSFIELKLDMPKDLKEHYESLRRDLYLDLGNDTLITAPSAAAKVNKLNQVSSGFVIDTDAKDTYLLSMYRFNYLMELLSSLGNEQVIIWCNYKKEFEVIKELLADKSVCVYGDVNIHDKTINIKRFKEGKVQYLLANPASADKGLTLTNSHICIYFSLNYSYELWKQSIERIYGDISKQPKKCLYYIFIAKSSVDSVIYKTINDKGDMSTAVLNHLKGGL